MDKFQKETYRESLNKYTEEMRKIFETLCSVCSSYPSHTEPLLSCAVSCLLDAIAADLSDPKKYRRINERALQLDTYKMVIVTYLTPAVFKMELPISGDFNRLLHDAWISRYPKQTYQTVTEDEIAAGFDRKWYQCYITQAVCVYLGKEDSCHELTAFRNFRDSYLRFCPDGPALIEEYYRTAPDIVVRMELGGKRDEIYPKLWKKYLKPCLSDIEAGRNEACRARYVEMVRALQKEYLYMEPAAGGS